MKQRFLSAFGPFLGLCIFALGIWIIHTELRHYQLDDILAHVRAIPPTRVVAALVFTALSYFALTGYDTLACRYVRAPLSYGRIALVSFIGYVFSHNVGLAFLGGSAVRYRMLSTWGIGPREIARIITFNVLTFWLGFLALAGVTLVVAPVALTPGALGNRVPSVRLLGVAFLCALAAYVVWSAVRRLPLTIRGFEITVPRPTVTAAQVLVSSLDWALSAAVLYVLLPESSLGFATVLGVYLLAQIAGVISHVPAGLGVFETVMLVFLSPALPGPALLGSLLAYRVVYYLLPMGVAVVLFGAHEATQHQRAVKHAKSVFGSWMPAVVPRIFTVTTVIAGVLMLVSGATAADPGRFHTLARMLPLPMIEISHLVGSIVGIGLLLLARALQQRIDAAYFLTLSLLAGGAIASLLKGLDYEEATILVAMFAALLPCRRYFYRRSSLLAQPFSAHWAAGIGCILIGTTFVTMLAHRHVEYANELWWQFELSAHAPRSLRALLGATAALLVYWAARLLRTTPPTPGAPTAADLDRAQAVISTFPQAMAHLALLGDKHLLFNEEGSAFLMYGVEKKSWVAMGDPVGTMEHRRELAWRFRELVDRHGGWTVFYEVGASCLPMYLDLGLSLRKLGEEARVPLDSFSLTGGSRKALRHSHRRVERLGGVFEMIPADAVPPLLEELRTVSDTWLAEKHTREKRFSLGFFDRSYLARLPVAVVRSAGRIVAFATIWASGSKEEVSIDLMRHTNDAPPAVMEYLFAELMLWSKAQGYRWFSLGMAPLAGFEQHPLAPLWNRLGAFLFRSGQHFYNFQGLRTFKNKFDPVWEARYLASPGGLAVPLVLTHVAALISGGLSGAVSK